jgi:CMP/dCMP kinase
VIGRVVALGGPPGSGKSTAGRRVADALGLEYCSAGDEFRKEATAHGMDLEAFGHFAEAHPEVDRGLDERMQARARPGVVLDGRIQAALCRRQGRAVYAIVVTADEAVRARRVAARDGQPVEEALRRIRERSESERLRYAKFYGLDPEGEPADLVVDSTRLPAEGVAQAITDFLTSRSRGATR